MFAFVCVRPRAILGMVNSYTPADRGACPLLRRRATITRNTPNSPVVRRGSAGSPRPPSNPHSCTEIAAMTVPDTITIDGPAGAGKSTLGELLAHRLGYLYFDTGIMYRAVTWEALRRGILISDEAAITRLAESLRI